jgi:hypothetical protein
MLRKYTWANATAAAVNVTVVEIVLLHKNMRLISVTPVAVSVPVMTRLFTI